MRHLAIFCALTLLATFCLVAPSMADGVAATVNGEPITAADAGQRMRLELLRSGDASRRVKALLTSDAFRQEFQQAQAEARPTAPIRSQAEVQEAAERIRKAALDEARRRALADRGGGAWEAAIEAVIGDRVMLQAAKKFDIEVSDEEVEQRLVQARAGRAELDAYYKELEGYGVGRETVRAAARAQIAWRYVIRRIYGGGMHWPLYRVYMGYSRGYLEELRRQAVVDFPA
jgi:peptidyl-prolyl cis-trans isomerase SurA